MTNLDNTGVYIKNKNYDKTIFAFYLIWHTNLI